MIEKFKKELDSFDGTRLTIAFADIDFKFSENTSYPNLCVDNGRYGLINPLEGRTVATLPEIHLALHSGCEITYHDAFVIESKEGYIFREHLQTLIDARNTAKKEGNELLQQLLKLYVNTLYGKTAQGIKPKNSFDIRGDGATKELGTSPITQPFFASMITGVLRAGLSALLVAIDELNKENNDYLVISATTDGMLYRVTSKDGIKFKDCLKSEHQDKIFKSIQNGGDIFKTFENVDPTLYHKCLEFPVLRLLQQSRQAWGYDEFIEIKHSANSVLNIKTRGQIGAYHEK